MFNVAGRYHPAYNPVSCSFTWMMDGEQYSDGRLTCDRGRRVTGHPLIHDENTNSNSQLESRHQPYTRHGTR